MFDPIYMAAVLKSYSIRVPSPPKKKLLQWLQKFILTLHNHTHAPTSHTQHNIPYTPPTPHPYPVIIIRQMRSFQAMFVVNTFLLRRKYSAGLVISPPHKMFLYTAMYVVPIRQCDRALKRLCGVASTGKTTSMPRVHHSSSSTLTAYGRIMQNRINKHQQLLTA